MVVVLLVGLLVGRYGNDIKKALAKEVKAETTSVSNDTLLVYADVPEVGIWDGESVDKSIHSYQNRTISINSAAQLIGFQEIVNGGFSYEGYTVELNTDIDLAGHHWTPIFDFAGVFDGKNHTIYNGVFASDITTGHDVGFFASFNKIVTIKNLTLSGFRSEIDERLFQSDSKGILLGGNYATGTRIKNVNVENSYLESNENQFAPGSIGLLIGKSEGSILIDGCTVSNSTLSNFSTAERGFGAILGENTTEHYNSVVKNCNVWNTFLFGKSNTSVEAGIVVGNGEKVTLENFHTNMDNYTGAIYDGTSFDFTNFLPEIVQNQIAKVGEVKYDPTESILKNRSLFGKDYGGSKEYEGSLLEKRFLVDGEDILPTIYEKVGSTEIEENVNNISIEFDTAVESTVSINGETTNNPSSTTLDINLGEGINHVVIEVKKDNKIIAQYDMLTGFSRELFSTVKYLNETPLDESPHVFKQVDGVYDIKESDIDYIKAKVTAELPQGLEVSLNGVSADENGFYKILRDEDGNLPSKPVWKISSGNSYHKVEFIETFIFWKKLQSDSELIYYRNLKDSPKWENQNGMLVSNVDNLNYSMASAEVLVINASSINISYDVSLRTASYKRGRSKTRFDIYKETTRLKRISPGWSEEIEEAESLDPIESDGSLTIFKLIHLSAQEVTSSASVTFDATELTSQSEEPTRTVSISSGSKNEMFSSKIDAFEKREGNSGEVTYQGTRYSDRIYYEIDNSQAVYNEWALVENKFEAIDSSTEGGESIAYLTFYLYDTNLFEFKLSMKIYNYTSWAHVSVDDVTNSESPVNIYKETGKKEKEFSIRFDEAGDHIIRIEFRRQASTDDSFVRIENLVAGNSNETVNINVDYNSEYGDVYNIAYFKENDLMESPTYQVNWSFYLQPFAVAKPGYVYKGYRVDGGDLISENGPVFSDVREGFNISFEFEPEFSFPDTKLDDFAIEFNQGNFNVDKNITLGEKVILNLIPAENTLLIKAPYLGYGETAKVYVNGDVYPMAEEREINYSLINNVMDNSRIKIVYSMEDHASYEFIYDIMFDADINEYLFSEASLTNTFENDELYPFVFDPSITTEDRIAFKAGNTGLFQKTSELKFETEGKGVLFFDYYIDSSEKDIATFVINNENLKLDEDGNDFYRSSIVPLGYNLATTLIEKYFPYSPFVGFLGTELVDGNYQNLDAEGNKMWQNARGNLGWRSWQIPIDPEVTGSQNNDIHIGLVNWLGSVSEEHEDKFAIANVRFVSDKFLVTTNVSNPEGGSISVDKEPDENGKYFMGSNITLTATVADGYQFYGWKDHNGKLISQNLVSKVTIMEESTYTAIIEPVSSYEAHIGSVFYENIEDAINASQSGDTVVLIKNATISEDVTISSGAKLLIPFKEDDVVGHAYPGTLDRLPWNLEIEPYLTLTINDGVSFTIDGEVLVGGVQHQKKHTAQGHTSGEYSQITNNGSIIVNGKLDVVGRITGSGSITTNSGSELRQPFMVNNFSGGTNTKAYYDENHFPFTQFAAVNIEVEQIINHGSKVIGSTSLFAMDTIVTQDIVMINDVANNLGDEGSLFWMHEGSRIEINYDPNKKLNQQNGNIHLGDSGVSTIDIYGNVTAGEFYLMSYGSNQNNMKLAVPYTYNINVKDGAKLTIVQSNSYKIMPGAIVKIEEGGTIDVQGRLYVFDGLIQAVKSGKVYPQADVLAAHGFDKSGMLIVDGTLNVASGATFAGIAQTTGTTGEIIVAEDAILSDTITEGAEDGYNSDRSVFNLQARIYGYRTGEITLLEVGKTYKAYNGNQFELESFSVIEADLIDEANYTVEINQPMLGTFLASEGEGKLGVYANVNIGEAVEGVVVNISGTEYTTDSEGNIEAYLIIDENNKFEYFTVGKQTDKYEGTYASADVTLDKVIKDSELSDENVYRKIYASDGTIETPYILKARLVYYGGEVSEYYDLEGDITETLYAEEVSLENAVYPALNTTHLLEQATQEMALYINQVEALETASSEELVSNAIEAYTAYEALIAERNNLELAFVNDYLENHEAYKQIIKEIEITIGVTYGDETVLATATKINGEQIEVTANNVSYLVQEGSVVAEFAYNGVYETVSYEIPSTTNNVLKKDLSVVIDPKTSVYGDPFVELTSTPTGLLETDSAEAVYSLNTLAFSENSAGEHVINAELLGDYQYLYSMEVQTGIYTITQREIVVTIDPKTSVYGDDLLELTSSVTGGNIIEGDVVYELSTLATEKLVVGEYTIEAVVSNDNYLVTAEASTYTITARRIDVVIESKTSSYGDELVELTAITPDAVAQNEGLNTIVSLTKAAGKNVGNYEITGETINSNYDVTFIKGNYEITKRIVVVRITDQSSVYGDPLAELTASLVLGNVLEGDVAYELATEATQQSDVGEYPITVENIDANYDVTAVEGTYTITVRPITVTADAKSTVYGDDIAELTARVTEGELQNEHQVSDVVTIARDSESKDAGLYNIVVTPSNNNYNITVVNAKYEIQARPIELVIESKTSVYGEELVELTVDYKAESLQLIVPDTLESVVTLTKEEGLDKGTYAITGAYDNQNYAITFTNGEYTITARPITVTADAKSTVYGDDIAELTAKVTEGELQNEHQVSDVVTIARDSESKDAGVYNIVVTPSNNNYNITVVNAKYEITARPIGVVIESKTSIYGDALVELSASTEDAVAQNEGLDTIVSLQKVAGENVGNYAITGEVANSNYTVTFTEGNYEITKRAIVVKIASQSSVYGDTLAELTSSLVSGNVLEGDVAYELATEATQQSDVGEYPITVENIDENYDVTAAQGTYTITVRPITVTADAKSTVYGDDIAELTAQVTEGELQNEHQVSDVVTIERDSESKDAGVYNIVVTPNNNNYNITVVNAKYEIQARPIELVIDSKESVYGEELVELTVDYKAESLQLIAPDTLENVVTLTKEEGLDKGTYAITGAYDNQNYAITFTNGEYTITARPITVTADAKSTVYGDDIAELTAKVTEGELQNEHQVSDVVTIARDSESVDAGLYNIVVTPSNDNYNITVVNAKYEIQARSIDVVIESKTSIYGDALVELSASTEDAVAQNEGLDTIVSLQKVAGENVGNYAITGEVANSNYTVTFTEGNYEITKRAIVVKIASQSSVYGDTLAKLTSSLVSGNVLEGDVAYELATEATQQSDVGEYPITVENIDENYDVTAAQGTYTITVRPITVTADAKSSVYGEELLELTARVTEGELQNEDQVSDVVTIARDSESKDAGIYNIVVTPSNNNYNITVVNAKYEITARQIELVIDSKESVYGEELAELTVDYKAESLQLIAPDTLESVVTLTKGDGLDKGTYAITGAYDNQNYAITFTDGSYEITARPIELVIDSKTSIYGEELVELTVDYKAESLQLIAPDTLESVVTLTKEEGLDKGTYAITGAYDNQNYAITFTDGQYEITALETKVTVAPHTDVMLSKKENIKFIATLEYGNHRLNNITFSLKQNDVLIATSLSDGTIEVEAGQEFGIGTYEVYANYENENFVITHMPIAFNIVEDNDYYSVSFGLEDETKVYDGLVKDFNIVVKVSETESVLEASEYTVSIKKDGIEVEEIKNVGLYSIDVVIVADNISYSQEYEITARPIELVIDSKESVYGEELVELTVDYKTESLQLIAPDTLESVVTLTKEEGLDKGTYAITGAYDNQNYAITFTDGEYTITQREIVVTIDPQTSVYGDALVELSASTEDAVAQAEGLNTILSLEKAVGENVGEYAITALVSNDNYLVSAEAGTYTITARPIDVVIDSKSSVYGNELVELTATTTDAVAQAEGLNTIVSLEKAAGENVGNYAITGEVANSNYTVTFTEGNYEITKRAIVVKIASQSSVYGDTLAELTSSLVSGNVLEGDTAYELTTTATNESNVGEYEITTTNESENYDVTAVEGTYTITVRPITVTADAKSSIYGDDIVGLTAQVTQGELQNEDQVSDVVTIARDSESVDAGIYNIVVTPSNNNYNITVVNAKYEITARPIELVIDSKTSIYGEELAELTVDYKAESLQLIAPDTLESVVTLTKEDGLDKGTYAITGAYDNQNYAITFTDGEYTITQREIVVTIDPQTSVYGDALVELSASTEDAVAQAEGLNTIVSLEKAAGENVGEYAITALVSNDNYLVSAEAGTYTITARPIDVVIDSKSSVYGNELVELTATTTDAVAQAEGLNTIVSLEKAAGQNVGNYAITGEVANSNYTVTFTEGNYEITKRAIVVKIASQSSVYGDTLAELTSSLVSGNIVEGDVAYELATEATQQSNVGEYPITVENINANYDVTAVEGTYTITVRSITVTADAKSSVYGEELLELTAQVTQGELQNEDQVSDVVTIARDSESKDAGIYNIVVTPSNNNYNITVVNAKYEITARPIELVIDSKESVYGEELAELTVDYEAESLQLIAPDTLESVVTLTKGDGLDKGTYAITGAYDNQNYAITFTDGEYTITQREIVVTIDPQTSVYGDALVELSASTEDAVAQAEGLNTILRLQKAAGEDVGEYAITALVSNDNYLVSAEASTYTITARPIDVVIESKTSVYGNELVELTATTTDAVARAQGLETIVSLEKAAGENVGNYVITGEVANSNYTVTFTEGNYEITKRSIVVRVDSKSSVYGDTLAELTSSLVLGNVVEGDTAYELTTNATNESNVGEYEITTTNESENYDVTAVEGTYTITVRSITVTADAKSSVYGEELLELTAQVTEGELQNGNQVSDVVIIERDSESVDAGLYNIVVTPNNANYNIKVVNGKYEITARPITVLIDPQTSVYGDDLLELTSSVTEGSIVEGDIVYTLTTTATNESDAGEYKIKAVVSNDNYSVTAEVNTYKIQARPIELVIDSKESVYGEELVELTVDYKAESLQLITPDTLESVVTLTKEDGLDKGTYTITGAYDNQNYAITFTDGSYEITARPIEIVINDKTSVYGDSDKVLDLKYKEGSLKLVGGLTPQELITLTREEGVGVGTYVISGTYEDDNYAITFDNGTYEITRRPITITIDSAQSIYGEEQAELVGKLTAGQVVYEDEVDSLFELSSDITNKTLVGKYDIEARALNDNYEITFANTTSSYEVLVRPIVVTILDKESVYGDALVELTASTEDAVAQNEGLDTIVSLTKAEGEIVGNYSITGKAINSNYEVRFEEGLYEIKARPITITIGSFVTDTNATFEEIKEKLSYELSEDLIGEDNLDVSVYVSISEQQLTNENFKDIFKAGLHPIKATYENSNYDVRVVEGILEVGKREVSVKDIKTTYTYTGEAINAFNWEENITNYLPSADRFAFKAVFYDLEDLNKENPKDYIINAGKYVMVLEIVYEEQYKFADDANLEYEIEVQKLDISESIQLIGISDTVILGGDIPTATVDPKYDVKTNITLTLDGKEVMEMTEPGTYTIKVEIEDDNFKGSVERTFRAIEDAYSKIIDFVEKLAEYEQADLEDKAKLLLELKEMASSFTEDELLQIEANESYKASLESYKEHWNEFIESASDDFKLVQKSYNGIFEATMTLMAMMTLLGFAIRRWLVL